MIVFCVFARVRACFRGYLPLNCHHDLRGNPLYLLGFLNHSRPLPIARPAPSNVRALWPQASPPSRSNVTPWPLAWVPGRTSRRRPCRRTSRRRHDWPRAKMRRKGLAIPRVHPLDVAGGLFILSPSASRSPGRSSRPAACSPCGHVGLVRPRPCLDGFAEIADGVFPRCCVVNLGNHSTP